ncbi:acetylxylan esterase [Verticillium alfalfae VaMs.102]|uniref:Acetylxylan esterase n=1 Tax=Verticillium alfalfae (strain VaMs.102 / ATCC MYA-4576 / FGSC 10136) TaxID=526221 RepID=C9SYA6_VERA1|nr:acetylxylan esterase [Verticillium alfalfae VaMs.102]EEY23771.1 acetylxylan esterase [Verticillium alfalfae VaMs.102]
MRFLSTLGSGLLALCATAQAASLQQITNFGANPSNAKMYIYVPDNVVATPPIVVAVHYCSGTAQAYFSGTPYRQLADQHGFIVIYPESPYSGTCWDVSSPASLTYEGGGNSNAIANMVRWTLSQHNGDAARVFVTGTSSGAMMTNVLAATYPDMFAAGIAYAGVPAGCFYTGTVNGWNSTCSQGNAAIKQWSAVFGYPGTPVSVGPGPSSQFVREIYGDRLQGLWGASVSHSVPIQGAEDMRWFGIGQGGTSPPPLTTTVRPPATTTTNVAVPPPATTTAAPPGGCSAARWGQCGGQGWTGCTVCASPYTCQAQNQWYSQCL